MISATNKDLRAEISAKRFREDLYYRLNVVPIVVPPLRERRNDIPAIAEHILKQVATETGRGTVKLSQATVDLFMSYPWPGNVRELQNWIQFAMVKCKEAMIEPKHLPPLAEWPGPQKTTPAVSVERIGRVRKLDAAAVNYALNKSNGNRVQAARLLGVSRATLYRFLEAEKPNRTSGHEM